MITSMYCTLRANSGLLKVQVAHPEGEVALAEDLGGQRKQRPEDEEHDREDGSVEHDPLEGNLHGCGAVLPVCCQACTRDATPY